MTSINVFRDDVETVGDRLIRTLPLPYLQRLGLQDERGGRAGGTPNKPTPCLDSKCVHCKILKCPDTIIGHNPLLCGAVVALIVIAVALIIAGVVKAITR